MATTVRGRMLRGAVLGFVLAAVLPLAGRAGAANETIQPNPTGYYTKTQDPFKTISGPIGDAVCEVPSPDPRTCLNPAQLTGGTPGYPRQDNYIYVATVNDDDDAHGAIGVPLFSVPPGSTIRSLVLDFFVENEASAGTLNFDPDDPAMQFCLITQGWAGQDGAPYESRPETNCEIQAEPKKVEEEQRTETTDEGAPSIVNLVRYTVDLMPMARAWAGGAENNGVLVRPTPEAPFISQTAIRTPAIAPDGMRVKVAFDEPAQTPLPQPDTPAAPTANAPTFADEPEADDPEPQFEVADDESTDETPSTQPVSSPGTPWWTYLGLPIGLAGLAGLGRGTAEPVRDAAEQRAGPVSRLMNRGGRDR